MVHCAGCHGNFSVSGYSGHVRRTQTPACVTAYNAQLHHENEIHENEIESVEEEAEAPVFLGDFFGDYEDDDFSWPDDEGPNKDLIDDDLIDVPAPAGHSSGPEPRFTVEPFPLTTAGAPIPGSVRSAGGFMKYGHNINSNEEYAPFCSKLDWDIARWAKLRGPSSSAVSELLEIEGFSEMLGLSYKNIRELNNLIDTQLPGRPHFHQHDVEIAGETVTMYSRDVVECIKALYGNAEFAKHMIFKPERHYDQDNGRQRHYHDLHTGDWWWQMQMTLEGQKPGATIVPILLSSDRTQVTQFGSKTAYPVYLTIGNLPKDIRRKPACRGQILLAYLPTTKLKHVTSDAARRRMLLNLFHSCLKKILQPLEDIGIEGIAMADGNGVLRRVHPILSIYVSDYPEQVLVTCTKSGRCPKCTVEPDELGSYPMTSLRRDLKLVNDALSKAEDDRAVYTDACKLAGIKPVFHPFWKDLPYVNIFQSITPDILHQLYQGIFRHLISWLTKAYSAAEIDARYERLVPNHHIRVFSAGISKLSRVTGKEHDQICRLLLGVIADMRLLGGLEPARLIRAIRGLLDFIYLSQFPVHSTQTLGQLDEALGAFHSNKSILIDLGIREHFNIPKLHACSHYASSIRIYGTTDNYNTQATERLHIDLAKDAYRSTNKKNEYPQMTTWLERREKMLQHDKYIWWCHSGRPSTLSTQTPPWHPASIPDRRIKMTRYPSVYRVSIESLVSDYGATYFRDAFARYVVGWRNPHFNRTQIERESLNVNIPFINLSVYHRIKFTEAGDDQIVDALHVQPRRKVRSGQEVPGRFDVALVRVNDSGHKTIHAFRAAQIRTVFRTSWQHSFHDDEPCPPEHLAYVEWFTPFRAEPEGNSRMYKVSRALQGTSRLASIIPVSRIEQSLHLIPLHGSPIPREWSSSTVLDHCETFLVNSFANRRTYLLTSG